MKDHPLLFSKPMVRANLDDRKTQTRRILSPEHLRIWTGGLDHAGRHVKPDESMFSAAMNNAREFRLVDGILTWVTDPAPHQVSAVMAQWQGRLTVNVGDRFWVKECFHPDPPSNDDAWDDHSCTYVEWSGCGCKAADVPNALRKPAHCTYRADPKWDDVQMIWKTGRYMPRWASRMTLVVEEVRIERLQDISEDDAVAEGITRWNNIIPYGVSVGEDAVAGGNTAALAYRALWNHINGPGAWDKDPWVVVYRYRVERRNIDADAR